MPPLGQRATMAPQRCQAEVKTMRTGPVPAQAIRGFAQEVAARFRPQRIVLFGSHARGTATADSDVDLLVVMETPARAIKQAQGIRLAVPRSFGLDLVVKTPAELARWIALGDTFLADVLKQGTVLYERADA